MIHIDTITNIIKHKFTRKTLIIFLLALPIESYTLEQKGYKSNSGNLQYKYIETDDQIDEATIMQKQKGLYQKNHQQDSINNKQSHTNEQNPYSSCHCQLMQECKAKICIFYCNCLVNDIPFIKYVFEDSTIEKAYLDRLEITDFKDFLEPVLPKDNIKIAHEQDIVVEYKWEGENKVHITFYERNQFVGELLFEKSQKQVTVYDNLAWVKQ
ncbi:hypothetical protein CQA66_05190 [Helicobacter aurati]|uniref:Uncharacterized protein n=1 Tax=Helicobacter aurati TaxID=137778 RepID=A0A3D8J5W5_9HELI|nr:hypothetical protein [Helicobacter aurati]RDU72274.1 hypothetical protein CQA66_05190 [Helicobacter aurati]